MFDLKAFSPQKLSVLVTFIVALSACSHEQIQISNRELPLDANEVSSTATPEPLSNDPAGHVANDTALSGQASLPASAPTKTAKHRHLKGKRHSIARHSHKKSTSKAAAMVASVKDSETRFGGGEIAATPSLPPALETKAQQPMLMPAIEPAETMHQGWMLWLGAIVISTSALLWFALRRNSRKGGKNRRLVYNA